MRKQEQTLRDLVKSFGEMAKEAQLPFQTGSHGIPAVLDRSQLKEHIRYCSWNIEWMDYFFKDDATFHTTNPNADIGDVDLLCKNIGAAVAEMDPDVLTILEGPGNLTRMQLFQKTYLGDVFQCFGFVLLFKVLFVTNSRSGINGGSQRIYILVRNDSKVKNPEVYVEVGFMLWLQILLDD